MTPLFDEPGEFAVLCDGEGIVRQIIHDGLGIREYLKPGESWIKLLDGGNVQKAFAFLTTVGLRDRAMGWEFNLVLQDRLQQLYFAGSRMPDGLLVVGATNPGSSASYSAAIGTGEAANADKPAWLFDELTRINNEVINVKRELDKKNFQLTQMAAELETRVKERTAELEAANQKLQQSIIERGRAEEKAFHYERLAAVGATVAKLAHEVANPLNAISAVIELAGRILDEPHVQHSFLISLIADVKGELDRLKSLLGELRSFMSQRKLSLEPVDLRALTEKFLMLQTIQYAPRGIRIVREFEANLPKVNADAAALTQVLLNLCKNAAEAMPQGGTLTLRGHRSLDQLVLEIADTGTGISEGVNIFEPFETTKAQGTGIGLSIVREIVSRHHGSVSYSSEPGHGTTFRVNLPIAQNQI